ncbi:HTH-type transcriptional activator CmpR [Oligella sp. MSHR50489EDL]|uniref:LysR substrate-binding domain-containing protein n=1 Tax=Oligella sp. MSHR50489EDL TaxID=3139409 RepID=UPI003D816F8A
MRITLKQLEIFLAVYHSGTTVAAAEQVFLSQSAISMALSELEKQLDTILFQRVAKRLIPTQQAHLLSPLASKALKQVEEIEYLFNLKVERLVVGASTTIGNYLLPRLIRDFQQMHPEIDIRLAIFNSADICEGLLNYDYDLGFIEGENSFVELRARKWMDDELVLFAANNSRFVPGAEPLADFTELEHLPLILREVGSGTRVFVQKHLLQHLERSTVMELGNSEAIKQAVINDLGVGCLSHFALQDLLELNKIRILSVQQSKPLRRPLYLLENKQGTHSAAYQKFVDFAFNYRFDGMTAEHR